MKRLVCWLLVAVLGMGLWPVTVQAEEYKAKSVVLMDVATGTVLYSQNAHEPLPPASVTKVMTMLLIMEAIDEGRLGWQDLVTASESAAAKGGSQVYLKVGETMTVEEMVKSIAVSSANDCACAMAEHLSGSEANFVEQMNRRAQELGMEHTHFVNCTGLDDDPEAAKHLTCAWDIGLMSRELLQNHPDITQFTTIWMDTIRDGAFGLSNTNKLVRFYPGCTGLKTGYTSAAGYCLSASAQREGLHLVAVVMGCQTPKERLSAVKGLLDMGFAGYASVEAQIPEGLAVPVKLGTAEFVQALPSETGSLLVEKGQKNAVTTEIQLSQQVSAPVSRGQQLGMVSVKVGQQVIRQYPLVAAETVPRLTWKDLAAQLLRQWFGSP